MKSLIRGKGKAMSLALSLAMALNLAVPAMAVDASGSTGTADAVLTQEAAAFSVSVPTVLPIAMDANQNISVADNLAIENNSRGQVKVSAAQVDAVGGWELVDYDTDFRAVKVDTKQFGFSLMGEPVPTTGEADATAFSVIDGQGELALTYDATVATQSMPTAETIARAVFTVGWNADAVDPYANYTPFTVTSENRNMVGYTGTSNENLAIPATFSADGVDYVVTSIGDKAFMSCTNLTAVNIPNSVTSIGNCAFRGCSGLTSITVSDSVTSMGEQAFAYCSGLTSVTIPDGVTSIGTGAFLGCSGLISIAIPDSVTRIGGYAFESCSNLTSVNIPDGVTSIGDNAFYSCSGLRAISVAAGNTSYKSIDGVLYSYDGTVLVAYPAGKTETSFAIPDGVTSIGAWAFGRCSGLTNISIPNSVTSIGEYAFESCSNLTSITLPNSVTSIGQNAFKDCFSLTSISIPNSVTSIGEYAFEGCESLTSISVDAAEGSIEGAPWGATNATINWLR